MRELDKEKIRLLGKYQISYCADTGLFYSLEEIPQEVQAQIQAEGAAYVEMARFLAKGKDAGGGRTALKWWSALRQIPVPDGDCVPLHDKNIYESIQLDWEEKEVCITDSGADMEMRELRGPRGSGVSVFYPYDATLCRDEREYKEVSYWLIDWVGRRVFSYEAAMSDSYEVRLLAFPLLRALGNLEEVFLWRDATAIYEDAVPRRVVNIL